MSFEIYVQAYRNGEQAELPREEVFLLFGDYAVKASPVLWKIYYDSQNSCDIYVNLKSSDESQVNSFTVYRPCNDRRLWNSLFAIIGLGHVALYFSGSHVLLRSEASVAHIPTDMVDALGGCIVVKDVEEILNELSAA